MFKKTRGFFHIRIWRLRIKNLFRTFASSNQNKYTAMFTLIFFGLICWIFYLLFSIFGSAVVIIFSLFGVGEFLSDLLDE